MQLQKAVMQLTKESWIDLLNQSLNVKTQSHGYLYYNKQSHQIQKLEGSQNKNTHFPYKLKVDDIVRISHSIFKDLKQLGFQELFKIHRVYVKMLQGSQKAWWTRIIHLFKGLGFKTTHQIIANEIKSIDTIFKNECKEIYKENSKSLQKKIDQFNSVKDDYEKKNKLLTKDFGETLQAIKEKYPVDLNTDSVENLYILINSFDDDLEKLGSNFTNFKQLISLNEEVQQLAQETGQGKPISTNTQETSVEQINANPPPVPTFRDLSKTVHKFRINNTDTPTKSVIVRSIASLPSSDSQKVAHLNNNVLDSPIQPINQAPEQSITRADNKVLTSNEANSINNKVPTSVNTFTKSRTVRNLFGKNTQPGAIISKEPVIKNQNKEGVILNFGDSPMKLSTDLSVEASIDSPLK